MVVTRTASAQSLAARPDLAITHATVIDVATGERLDDRTILIVGNRIRRVDQSRAVPVPAGMRIVDATGKFVIPGLWDMHVHTVSDELDFPMEVANGITGVRDMGGSTQYPPPGNWGIHFDSLRLWRSAIRAGSKVGPRVVAGGVALDGPEPAWPQTLSIKTADEGRRVVDSLRQRGVDFIKVYARLPKDILLAIASQAEMVGLPFAGHVSAFMNAEEAAEAGQRSLEHANALDASYLDGETIRANLATSRSAPVAPGERARQMGRLLATDDSGRLERAAVVLAGRATWTDPTLVALRSLTLPFDKLRLDTVRMASYTPLQIREVWNARLATAVPPEMLPVLAERLRLWERGVRVLHRKGAGILVGSDAWNPYVMPGFGLHDEMELLVRQGIPPLEVLRAATLGAARYLEMSDSLGTIAPGQLADLVLLDGDPLRDIRNVRRVGTVVLDGRVLERRDLDALLAGARASASRRPR